MPTISEPIRVRAIARDHRDSDLPPRAAFWEPARLGPNDSDLRVPQFEAKLCRELGTRLRSRLVAQLSEGLEALEGGRSPGVRDLEWFFRSRRTREREAYANQFVEAFTRHLEHRRQVFRESPVLRAAQERIAAAAGVFFSTRIAGYSSLSFEMSTGSLEQLAIAFENNFDSFRVFLEAFVPVAFGDVFSTEFADGLEFAVAVPSSWEQAFEPAVHEPTNEQRAELATIGQAAPTPAQSTARARAEWLWRLANGSLLIPVLIAIVVMFYGIQLLSEIRASQSGALQPILQHQLELLKEDRLRMATPPTQKPTRGSQAPSQDKAPTGN